MSDLFAAPSKEEIAVAKATPKPDLFAPPSKDELAAAATKAEQNSEGPMDAAISGLAHGLTFGASDKIIAAARAGIGKLRGEGDYGPLYDKYQSEGLGRTARLSENNPKSYLGGQLGGAVINPVNKFLPGGTLAKNVATGVGVGAVNAAGQSDTHPTESYDDLQKFLSDVKGGAEVGAAGGVAGTVLGNAVSALPKVLKKGAAVLLGAPEDAVERYIANPDAVRNAPTIPEAVGKFKNLVGDLKDKVIEASQNARAQLGPESEMTGSDIAQMFQQKIDDITSRAEGVLDSSDEATIKWLQKQQAPYAANADKTLSGSRVKDLVQKLQDQGEYGQLPGEFSGASQRVVKGVTKDVNEALKTASPEYRKAMVDTAKKSELLEDAQGLFKSDQGLANTLNRVRRGRAPFAEETINKLDQEFGTQTVEDMRNALARESFEKGAQTPGGSRNVNLYRGLLRQWAEKNSIPFGEAIGALIGGTVDKHGPGIAKAGIDAYRGVATNPYVQNYSQGFLNMGKNIGVSPKVTPAITEYLQKKQEEGKAKGNPQASVNSANISERLASAPETLGPYAGQLAKAAQNGEQSLAVAHYVLAQNDPRYQDLFKNN